MDRTHVRALCALVVLAMFTVTFAPSASAQPKHRDPAVPWEAGGQEAGIWMDKVSALIAEQQYEAAMQAIGNIVNYVNAMIAEQQAEAARAAEVARVQQQQVAQQPAPRVQPSAPTGGAPGACGGATNGADQFIHRESGGNPNISNSGGSGAYGCYQIMPATWASSCRDLGPEIGSSPATQAQCASRLPLSAWGG